MDMAEAILQMIDVAQDAIAGPVPARVVSYDATAGRATVDPVITLTYGSVTVTSPHIEDVPVVWPGGSRGGMTAPLEAGDVVYLVPAGWDLDSWKADGGSGSTTGRRFDLSDCVAIPGVERTGRDPDAVATDGPVIQGSRVYLGGSTATDWVALASLVLAQLQAIQASITSINTALKTHEHEVYDTGSPPTKLGKAWASGVEGTAYAAGSVASNVVRSK